MTYIRKLQDGKSQVIKDTAFTVLLKGAMPNPDKLITELISELDSKVYEHDKSVTKDAMNNVHGDWYEWLLAITAWNYCIRNKKANLALLTPNIAQFDVGTLYNERLYALIQDLRQKVQNAADVQLISSNPDFVIIDKKVAEKQLGKLDEIKTITEDSIKLIENAYSSFIHKCDFESILGYVSVKTSLRPDRRLQIAHEGSLMKAIYTHLQTREWIIKPKGIKYFAITTNPGPADIKALKTVATHSITMVQSIPQAAVDDVYAVNSIKQAEEVYSKILID